MGIAMDVWLFVAPLPELARLNMSLRKKLMVGSMFALGIVVTAISIVRLLQVRRIISSTNPTGELSPQPIAQISAYSYRRFDEI